MGHDGDGQARGRGAGRARGEEEAAMEDVAGWAVVARGRPAAGPRHTPEGTDGRPALGKEAGAAPAGGAGPGPSGASVDIAPGGVDVEARGGGARLRERAGGLQSGPGRRREASGGRCRRGTEGRAGFGPSGASVDIAPGGVDVGAHSGGSRLRERDRGLEGGPCLGVRGGHGGRCRRGTDPAERDAGAAMEGVAGRGVVVGGGSGIMNHRQPSGRGEAPAGREQRETTVDLLAVCLRPVVPVARTPAHARRARRGRRRGGRRRRNEA